MVIKQYGFSKWPSLTRVYNYSQKKIKSIIAFIIKIRSKICIEQIKNFIVSIL